VPEWFFLPLDQLLLVSPQTYLVFFGSVILVGIAATLFICLPWLDRSSERAPLRRPEILVPALFAVFIVVFLTLLGTNRLYNL
jgi:menaquinol-cytochrome c reductase cytochrome b/c subunit